MDNMTRRAQLHIMNANIYSMLQNRKNFSINCYNCDISINIGDKYVSHTNSRRGINHIKYQPSSYKYKIYCVKCAEEKNII
jgi:hypothetical protein